VDNKSSHLDNKSSCSPALQSGAYTLSHTALIQDEQLQMSLIIRLVFAFLSLKISARCPDRSPKSPSRFQNPDTDVSSPPPRAHSPLLERTPTGPDSPLSAYGGSAPAGGLPLQEIGAGTSTEARLREEVCSSACVFLAPANYASHQPGFELATARDPNWSGFLVGH
jgi:hypothetical protein